MKAVVLNEYGDVTKLEYQDFAEPRVGANDIKVRMAGAGLNPIDWKLRSGAYKAMMPLSLPAVLGRAAVFTAKARGAIVWAAVRGTQKVEASKLGADGVVSLDDDADIARLPTLDGIADTVGGATVERLLTRMKPTGTIASAVGEPAGAKARGLVVRAMMARTDAAGLGTLAQAVADGKLFIPIARKYPLAQARAAQTLAENHAGGKVLLTGAAQA